MAGSWLHYVSRNGPCSRQENVCFVFFVDNLHFELKQTHFRALSNVTPPTQCEYVKL